MADSQSSTSSVIYKFIPGFPGFYRIGNDGTVWSRLVSANSHGRVLGEWRQLKLSPIGDSGRLKVALRRDGKTVWATVHRLVLEAFVGPCPEGMEACHWDDNPKNNRLSNLRWDTHVSNCEDRSRNGTYRGENCPNARLTEDRVRQLREARAAGATYTELETLFGINRASAHNIVTRKAWKHVS